MNKVLILVRKTLSIKNVKLKENTNKLNELFI